MAEKSAYLDSIEASLSSRAKQWLDNYQPRHMNVLDKLLASFSFSTSNMRPATKEKDYTLLLFLAQQCDLQDVKFPKKVTVVKRDSPNAAHVLGTRNYLATEGIGELMEPEQMRAVIAHEVGHGKQGMFGLGLLIGAIYFTDRAIKNTLTYAENKLYPSSIRQKIMDSKTASNLYGLASIAAVWYGMQYVVSALSRQMEYDADRRAALHSSPEAKKAALEAFRSDKADKLYEQDRKKRTTGQKILIKINRILLPFKTHPSLSDRITRLEEMGRAQKISNQPEVKAFVSEKKNPGVPEEKTPHSSTAHYRQQFQDRDKALDHRGREEQRLAAEPINQR